MACPDKENDERIIAEIALRHKANNSVEKVFQTLFIEGELRQVLWMFTDNQIQSITNIGDSKWQVIADIQD